MRVCYTAGLNSSLCARRCLLEKGLVGLLGGWWCRCDTFGEEMLLEKVLILITPCCHGTIKSY